MRSRRRRNRELCYSEATSRIPSTNLSRATTSTPRWGTGRRCWRAPTCTLASSRAHCSTDWMSPASKGSTSTRPGDRPDTCASRPLQKRGSGSTRTFPAPNKRTPCSRRFGSHTAWMFEPYDPLPPAGSPPSGIAYRSDDEVVDFFAEAQATGLQTGVHAIGDAAIEQALRSWEAVAHRFGLDEVRSLRHRIEHFECSSDDHIRRAAQLNIGISLQPAFDRYWGGPEGLYAQRLGWDRARWMNRAETMVAAGLTVGAGSDSTVTPLDPFVQMAALRAHHVPEERLDAEAALRVHTQGSLALSGSGDEGVLTPGAPADIVLVDRDPVESSVEELQAAEVLGTWIGGARVGPDAERETP